MMSFFTRLVLSLLLGFSALSFAAYAEEKIRYEFSESSRAIMRVGPHQSLDLLIEQMYPNNRDLWPRIKEEIRRINPHAFNRYTGRLMEGQRLKLVTVRKIREGTVNNLNQVGRVIDIKGFARATDKSGKDGRLVKDSLVYEGDRLVTSGDAELLVKMIDGAELRIKPNSSVRISEYVMKSGFESGSRSIIDLIKGGLRKITGSIGANPLSVYRFHAGVLTIGVRGTDYVVKLCQQNDCEKSVSRNDQGATMHVAVLDGLITLQDEEGVKGELALGQYAVASEHQIVQVDDSSPVKGLLNAEEKTLFDKMEPKEKEKNLWPWLIGGALLGI